MRFVHHRHRWLVQKLLAAWVAAVALSVARAQGSAPVFDIPAQDAASGLVQFGDQARLQILFDYNAVQNLNGGAGSDMTGWMQSYTDCLGMSADGQGKKLSTSSAGKHGARCGSRLADGRAYFSCFNTIMPPNRISCMEGTWDGSWGVMTASSRHSGGVQAAMGDGSVRFVAETVDLATYRAAGSRGGGESLQLP